MATTTMPRVDPNKGKCNASFYKSAEFEICKQDFNLPR